MALLTRDLIEKHVGHRLAAERRDGHAAILCQDCGAILAREPLEPKDEDPGPMAEQEADKPLPKEVAAQIEEIAPLIAEMQEDESSLNDLVLRGPWEWRRRDAREAIADLLGPDGCSPAPGGRELRHLASCHDRLSRAWALRAIVMALFRISWAYEPSLYNGSRVTFGFYALNRNCHVNVKPDGSLALQELLDDPDSPKEPEDSLVTLWKGCDVAGLLQAIGDLMPIPDAEKP